MFQFLWYIKVLDVFRQSSRAYRRLSRNELCQRHFLAASQRHCFFDNSNDLAWVSGTVFFHCSNRRAESLPFPELTLVVKETTMDSFNSIVCWRRIKRLQLQPAPQHTNALSTPFLWTFVMVLKHQWTPLSSVNEQDSFIVPVRASMMQTAI